MMTLNLGKIIPQKYLDYWTPEDIAEIETYINSSVADSLGDYENCLKKITEIQNTIIGKFANTPTDNRTTLAYWYQHLGVNYRHDSDEEGDYVFIGEDIEELEYPKGTKNVTNIENLFTVYILNDRDYGQYEPYTLPVKKFIGTLDLSSVTSMYCLFSGQISLTDIGNIVGTHKCTDFRAAFRYCSNLPSIPELDCRSATLTGDIVSNCSKLTSLRLKNLKVSTQIGSGTSWGHLINVDDLIFMIYHLRDTGSSKTFTIGSDNLDKLANVYVRTISITDKMRAEDDLIDEKLPFEVCESTDEGAIRITDYVTLKNWILK